MLLTAEGLQPGAQMEARRQRNVWEREVRARLYVGETEKRPTLQAVYVDVGWMMIGELR